MLYKLKKAYSVAELSITAFEKKCYKQKVNSIYKVWNNTTETFYNMTYTEYTQEERFKVVAIELTDNNAVYYGIML